MKEIRRCPHLFLAPIFAMGLCVTATAHDMRLSAHVTGETIVGRVDYGPGRPASGATVKATGPGGIELGEAVSAGDGTFALRVAYRCDHVLTASDSSGHRATYTVRADELPSRLPSPEEHVRDHDRPHDRPPAQARGHDASEGLPMARLTAMADGEFSAMLGRAIEQPVEDIVSRQLIPVRRQIERLERTARIRDILGGIGYIFGLMGVILYLKSARRNRA